MKFNNNIENMNLKEKLIKYFNFEDFRSFEIYSENLKKEEISQEYIIKFVLNELLYSEETPRDMMFVASTGGGKSLIYQMLGRILHDMNLMTIIIDPLKTLMNDQIKTLKSNKEFGDIVEKINSDTTYEERKIIYENIQSGKTSIVYVSPEFLANNPVNEIFKNRQIGLFVIDEAHVVNSWGNTFRADYGYLGDYLEDLQELSNHRYVKLALTATAIYKGELDTVNEIKEYLNLRNPEIIITNYRRDNIDFNIIKIDDIKGSFTEYLYEKIILRIKDNIKNKIKTIVYCPFKSHVYQFKRKIQYELQKVGYLTGDTSSNERKNIQERFKSGNLTVVIATKAFGMGVDVPDVREVIHFKLPNSLIDYIQEIGRSGRDGDKSKATVFYNEKSIKDSNKLEKSAIPAKWQLEHTYKAIKKRAEETENKQFRISSGDISHLFNGESSSSSIQKSRSALFIVERQLERNFNKKILKKIFEGNQKLYFGILKYDADIVEKKVKEIKHIPNETFKNDFNYMGNEKKILQNFYELDVKEFLKNNYPDISYQKFIYNFFWGNNEDFFGKNVSPKIYYKLKIFDYEKSKETLEKVIDFFNAFLLEDREDNLLSGQVKQQTVENHLKKYIRENYDKLEWINESKTEITSKITRIFSSFFIDNKENEMPFAYFNKNNFLNLRYNKNIAPHIRENILKIFENSYSEDTLERDMIIDIQNVNSSPSVIIASILEMLHQAEIQTEGEQNGIIIYEKMDELPEELKITKAKELKENIEKQKNIMTEFFETEMNNEQRWDYIEKYFLKI
ncbi:RecQ family ATP-dependent DNA helicase [Oceanotoga sp. DSM 15011]|uniref:RecQ family ATP-dependent DNA helicase n=1 Tax=Oceanotoga TaxID=1255275 RepID=UPI0021F4014B|nr:MULTISPECIES: RecQ family ATP-dependent DNA helicase [Oceanotoga]MDO7976169.1 RecQ family ATP-dependent DNA helicase [Oceanotoga teriensis]UYP01005.1 RecQ family ATP-dependent DNA helicase [Oceanotoga sp. DSM 15011]